MRRITFILIFFIVSIFAWAQPNNYWSMGSNTQASILAGAVVGGGSGITSIFYNPAGISELTSNNISLDASLFHFNYNTYTNPYGHNKEVEYLDYEVQPRFFSYLFHPKSTPKLSIQVAIFSRGISLVKLADFGKEEVVEPVSNIRKTYSVNFDYENRYADYWGGIGMSYSLSDKLIVGYSLLGSIKVLTYYHNAHINLVPIEDTLSDNSNWQYYDRQDLYVVSLINKFGLQYRERRWTIGMNITTPSMRLYGDGYHRREVSMTNIYDNGVKVPDLIISETNNHIVANFKEPFSVSAGVTYISKNERTRLFFSAEYFADIKSYKAIDNSRVANYYKDDYSPGTDFLTFHYGAKSVFNVGFGMRHNISEKMEILGGFKTDFSSYNVKINEGTPHLNQYQRGSSNLYHITGGIRSVLSRGSILLGLEYTFGYNNEMPQFGNYHYPGVYDPNKFIALQDMPQKNMKFAYNGIGIYFGLVFSFD